MKSYLKIWIGLLAKRENRINTIVAAVMKKMGGKKNIKDL